MNNPHQSPIFPNNVSLDITLSCCLLWALQPTWGLLLTSYGTWFLWVWSGSLLEPHPRLSESESAFQPEPPEISVHSKGWEAVVSKSGPLSHSICGYHPPRPVCLSLACSEQWLPPWWHLTSPWTASSTQEETYLPLVPLQSVPEARLSVLCSRWMNEWVSEWMSEKHWGNTLSLYCWSCGPLWGWAWHHRQSKKQLKQKPPDGQMTTGAREMQQSARSSVKGRDWQS